MISPVLDEISFWNFLETFPGCFWTFSKLFWIFCMSVSLVVGILPYWYPTMLRYLQFWMRCLSEFSWTHSWDVGTLVPNNFKFLIWRSSVSVLPGLNLLHINTIVSLVGHLLRHLVLLVFIISLWKHGIWQ